MSVTTIGALVGGVIDSMGGDDNASWDGALKGAVVANVLKLVVPAVVTWAVGWAVLRGAAELKDKVFGDVE